MIDIPASKHSLMVTRKVMMNRSLRWPQESKVFVSSVTDFKRGSRTSLQAPTPCRKIGWLFLSFYSQMVHQYRPTPLEIENFAQCKRLHKSCSFFIELIIFPSHQYGRESRRVGIPYIQDECIIYIFRMGDVI